MVITPFVQANFIEANELDETKDNLIETLECQNGTYQEMVNHGWYTINNIDNTTIKQTYDKVISKE